VVFGFPDEDLEALVRAEVTASYARDELKDDMERGIGVWTRATV